MAAIGPLPSQYSQAGYIKDEPVVQTAEVQPESDEQENASEVSDGEPQVGATQFSIAKKTRPGRKAPPNSKPPPKKEPVKTLPITDRPVTTLPIPDMPINILPVPNKPQHPIFVPNGTTLDNVTTHMLCNDWFLTNVRNLVEEYKKMQADNMRQARDIMGLTRENTNLKEQVRSITEERDEYKNDYYSEVLQHQNTRDALNRVRLELADLRTRYNRNLAELQRHRALLSEALRENSRLKVEIADQAARIKDLEEKLRISNASEDKANETVTELQRVIYELERTKTSLERQKDRAEQTSRAADDNVKRLSYKITDLNRQIRALTKGVRIGINSYEAAEAPMMEAQAMAAPEPPLMEAQAMSAQDPLFEALTREQPISEEAQAAAVPEDPLFEALKHEQPTSVETQAAPASDTQVEAQAAPATGSEEPSSPANEE